jgi:hypothetical protein
VIAKGVLSILSSASGGRCRLPEPHRHRLLVASPPAPVASDIPRMKISTVWSRATTIEVAVRVEVATITVSSSAMRLVVMSN